MGEGPASSFFFLLSSFFFLLSSFFFLLSPLPLPYRSHPERSEGSLFAFVTQKAARSALPLVVTFPRAPRRCLSSSPPTLEPPRV
jgi:hypothetical protein